MKTIIKEKSSIIVKAIIFQIAMSMFGIMLTSSIQNFSTTVKLLAGIFSILFYFALIGAALNEDGLKDNIKISHGRADADAFLGIKYMSLSYIPSFLITSIYILLRLFGLENVLTFTLNTIIRLFLSGMYLGFDVCLFTNPETLTPMSISLNGWTFLIYQVISVFACGLFYYLGLKGIDLVPSKKTEQ